VDKLVGFASLKGVPTEHCFLQLSGRVSLEVMQKALMAQIPAVCAISAPTSLAVDFAQESQQTLVGFIRSGTMNVYAGQVSAP